MPVCPHSFIFCLRLHLSKICVQHCHCLSFKLPHNTAHQTLQLLLFVVVVVVVIVVVVVVVIVVVVVVVMVAVVVV